MSLLGEVAYALIQPSARAIGMIFADVTVEENHRDEVIITQHPIEGGGVITDHAYKRPAELEIRCGFSNSSAGYVGYVQQQYQALLALQLARQPFSVYTGKRRYRNMLIRGLSVVTDPHSENILMASVALQEVILAKTQTTGNTGSNTASPGANSDQANPSSTADIANRGDQSGIGQGSQSFAGAFNPGSYSTDGGTVPSPTFTASMDGISPPTATAEVGELTATDASGNALPDATVPASPGYNPFATGAFGGT